MPRQLLTAFAFAILMSGATPALSPPVPAVGPVKGENLHFYFSRNETAISADGEEEIGAFVDRLYSLPYNNRQLYLKRVTITAYADTEENDPKSLSNARAKVVAEAIAARGVSAQDIEYEGIVGEYGEIAENYYRRATLKATFELRAN